VSPDTPLLTIFDGAFLPQRSTRGDANRHGGYKSPEKLLDDK
jgi:hypothetical protein